MSTTTSIIHAVLAGLTTAVVLTAQGKHHTVAAKPAAIGLAPGTWGLTRDGNQWFAVGDDYKARFNAAGVVFVPALGAAAPRNLPLGIHYRGWQRGETKALPLPRPDLAPVQVRDGVVILERATELSECFAVMSVGIEHRMILGRSPAGRGDLMIRFGIDTELTASRSRDGLGIEFSLPAMGGVSYGGLQCSDANGLSVAGRVEVGADELRWHVDADFLDNAVYPVVLDPLIGTILGINPTASPNSTEPDVAYDVTRDRWLVAWRRIFSGLDSDIHAQLFSGVGVPVGSLLALSGTGVQETRPTVANVNAANRFLVAWQRADSPIGPWDVQGVAVDAASGAVSAPVMIANAIASESDPDAAGDRTSLSSEALVVWANSGSGIVGCRVSLAAPAPVVIGPFAISTVPGDGRPAISKSSGTSARHVVVWDRYQTGPRWDVVAQCVSHGLALLGRPVVVDTGGNRLAHADVDGEGTEFLVAFEKSEPTTSEVGDVMCRPVRWSGSSLGVTNAPLGLATTGGLDEGRPAVGFLGQKYLVAWEQEYPNGVFDQDIHVRMVTPGCTTCDDSMWMNTGAIQDAFEGSPVVATMWSGGSTADQALVTCASGAAALPFTSRVLAMRFEEMVGGTVVIASGPCGTSSSAGTNGPVALGNLAHAFTLSGAPASATLGLLMLGVGAAPPLACMCPVVDAIAFYGQPISGGAASVLFPLPCNPAFLGTVIDFQWGVYPVATTACSWVPGWGMSDLRRVTLTR